MSDSRPASRGGSGRHSRSVSADLAGAKIRSGASTPQGREESSAEGAAIAASSTSALASSASPSSAATGAHPVLAPSLIHSHSGRVGRSRGHSRANSADLAGPAMHSARSSRSNSISSVSGAVGSGSGAGGVSGLPAHVLASMPRKQTLLRSSSFDRVPSPRRSSFSSRPGSPAQSSRALGRAHLPSSRAAPAAHEFAATKPPPRFSASFRRARARWHAALAFVVNQGGSALAAKQAFIRSSFFFSKLSKEKQASLQNQLRKANFKKGTGMDPHAQPKHCVRA